MGGRPLARPVLILGRNIQTGNYKCGSTTVETRSLVFKGSLRNQQAKKKPSITEVKEGVGF